MKVSQSCLVLTLSLALFAPAVSAEEVDLQPIREQLESSSVADRIRGIRDMMRHELAPDVARPMIEDLLSDGESTVRVELVWAVHELLGADGADLLDKLYQDPDRLVRDAAIRAACRMFDESGTKQLCKAASGDPDFAARVEVISTLREYYPEASGAAEIFRDGLDDPSEMVQRAAVFGSQAARDPKAVPKLVDIAMNATELAAVPAADEALATIGTEEAVDALVNMLEPQQTEDGEVKPTDPVRAAAARALARIKNPKSIEPLRKALDDPYVPLRIGAMSALTALENTKSAPIIAKQLSHEVPRVRRYALRSLRQLGNPEVADRVAKTMREDEEPVVRATAVPTLADLIGEKAIPMLEEQASDPEPQVRLEIAGSLAGLGKPAGPVLARFVEDSDPGVRTLAIEGLGQIGGEEEIELLEKVLHGQDENDTQIRGAIAQALGAIGHEAGLDLLNELAGDAEPYVRQRAAVALGEVGGDQAKKALQALLKDDVPRVRHAARLAMQDLD
jgi:HEAT repeat protein